MQKMNIYKILIYTLACGIYLSCNDPIFYLVESEVKPKTAKIPGSPSRIVAGAGDTLYVANGSLWQWTPARDRWEKTDGPAGALRDLAYTGGALYALSVANNESALYKKADGGAWGRVAAPDGYGFIQGIYDANGTLFAYARGASGGDYRVCVEIGGTLTGNFAHELYGVAFMEDSYYFATNDGIYQGNAAAVNGGFADPQPERVENTDGKGAWLGIASNGAGTIASNGAGTIVAAASKSGWVFLREGTDEPIIERKESSYAYDSALCFWQKTTDGDPYLLIGIRGSAYTNGYRELDLRREGGVLKPGSSVNPAASVESSAKYASTLGIHALTSIMQAPGNITSNGYPLVFASTQQHGLWSYRGVWNAEE